MLIVQGRQSGISAEQVEAGNAPPGARKNGEVRKSTAFQHSLLGFDPLQLSISSPEHFFSLLPSHSDQPHSTCVTEARGGLSPVEINREWEDGG